MAKARTTRAKEKKTGIGKFIAHAPAPVASPLPLCGHGATPTGWNTKLARYAKALAIRYNLQGFSQTDAVHEAVTSALLRPPKHRQAEIRRVIRKHLANSIHVPAAHLPEDEAKVQAVTHYAAAPQPQTMADKDDLDSIGYGIATVEQQDIPFASCEDRLFAEENGICPRCNELIDLDTTDQCACGLRF